MTISQRKAGTILSYVQIFLSNTISLIYTPLMLSILGQSEYGLYGTAGQFTSYLSLLNFGISGAYIKYNIDMRAQNDKEGEAKLNGMFFILYSVISFLTVVVGIGMMAASDYVFQDSFTSAELIEFKKVMICIILNMIVTLMFNTIAMALIAYEKFIFIRCCLIFSGIISPIANLCALYFWQATAFAIAFTTVVISFLTYIFYFIYAKKKLRIQFRFRNFDMKIVKGVFIFSSFLLLNSITDMITNSTDTVILGAVSGTVAAAVYTIGSTFKGYFLAFSTSVSNVFAPQVNQIVSEKRGDEPLNEIFIRIGRVQFLIVSLILIGYIFIGQQFINTWAGPDYSGSYIIGLMLLIAVFVPSFQNVGLEIQKAKNLHKVRSITYLAIAVLNVIITIPLSMKYGGAGAAFATMICMLGGNFIFMNIYYHKRIGLNILHFWKSILSIVPSFIPTIIVGILLNCFYTIDSYSSLLLAVLILVVVYCVSVWFFGMNSYEKNLISSPFKKIIKKIFHRGSQV